MKVALDLTPAVISTGGVARYALALHDRLVERDDVEVVAFSIGRGRAVPGRRLAVPLRVAHAAWRTLHVPGARLLAGRADVLHSIDLVPPPSRLPLVVTVHDVLPITHPELYPPAARAATAARLEVARRAAIVVTTSASTGDEIASVGGLDRAGIVVAQPGWERVAALAPATVPVDGPFVLCVGAVTPRKGYDVLAEALARLGDDAPVVVVAGPDWWRADEVRAATAAAPAGKLRFLGEVTDDVLAELYRQASAFCSASLAEGYGMPVVEALGHGVPVVATDLPVVRELAGDAALLVAPGDADALADGLRRVGDAGVAATLAAAGPTRVASLTWAAMADRVVGAYRSASRR